MTDTSAEALLKAIEALPFTVADNLSFKCEYRGFQDGETGEVPCGMEKNGGDCLCADRFEMADRIAASLKVHTAGLRNALAAERAQPPADVVERVARALLSQYYPRFTAQNPNTEVRLDAWWSTCRQTFIEDATAALSAIRPGDELPSGVVVPRDTLQCAYNGVRVLATMCRRAKLKAGEDNAIEILKWMQEADPRLLAGADHQYGKEPPR